MSKLSEYLTGHKTRLREQHWPKKTKPLVSVSCIAYNQRDYIEQCIESFLMQKTSFPVEIIIFDDASSDGTTEIIEKYKKAFPSLIKCNFQSENQFSNGVVVGIINLHVAKGRYIAFCHGDDYWTSENKLQNQLKTMLNLSVGISGHPARVINNAGDDLCRFTGYMAKDITHLPSSQLIKCNGNMLPYSSIMIDSETAQNLLLHMPPVRFHTGIQLLGAMRNGLIVMPDAKSAYRVEVPGSVTELILGDDEKKLKTSLLRIESIKHLKKLYGRKNSFLFDFLLSKQILSVSNPNRMKNWFLILNTITNGKSFFYKAKIITLYFVSHTIQVLRAIKAKVFK